MTRSPLVGLVSVVLACGALTACASGHAGHAQTSRAISPTAGTSVPGDRTVHLTDYADSDSSTSSIILSGAVGDFGSAKRDHGGQLDLQLSRGTLRLDIANLDRQFLAQMRQLAVNQHSCSAAATASSRAPIVAGSGTGAYSNVSGTFDLTMTLDEVYRYGACREIAPYLAQKIIVTGWGDLSLG